MFRLLLESKSTMRLKKTIPSFLLLFTCLIFAMPFAAAQAQEGKVEIINDQDPLEVTLKYDLKKDHPVAHPDFILPSIEDPSKTIQLSKYRGKKVLLLHFASL